MRRRLSAYRRGAGDSDPDRDRRRSRSAVDTRRRRTTRHRLRRRNAEFHFIRTQYTDLPQYHRGFGYSSRDGQGSGWWIVDWPAADNHFTRYPAADQNRYGRSAPSPADRRQSVRLSLDLRDPDRMVGLVGRRSFCRLREYLLRGGFLVVDDFWGSDAWDVFQSHHGTCFA